MCSVLNLEFWLANIAFLEFQAKLSFSLNVPVGWICPAVDLFWTLTFYWHKQDPEN